MYFLSGLPRQVSYIFCNYSALPKFILRVRFSYGALLFLSCFPLESGCPRHLRDRPVIVVTVQERPVAVTTETRCQSRPRPVEASRLEQRTDSQHTLPPVTTPSLSRALHVRCHENLVGRFHKTRSHRVARCGGIRIVPTAAVSTEECPLPADIVGPLSLPEEMAQRVNHFSYAYEIMTLNIPPLFEPGRSGDRVRTQDGISRHTQMLSPVPDV